MTTVTDVEKALTQARELEDYWINKGWQSLQVEKETMSNEILDIYPLVGVDISVTITIRLPDNIYTVPLEDVSSLSINECLVIGVEDLYPDWEQRVLLKLGGNLVKEEVIIKEDSTWEKDTYLGEDNKLRIVWQRRFS